MESENKMSPVFFDWNGGGQTPLKQDLNVKFCTAM